MTFSEEFKFWVDNDFKQLSLKVERLVEVTGALVGECDGMLRKLDSLVKLSTRLARKTRRLVKLSMGLIRKD